MDRSFVLCGAYVMEADGSFSDPRDVLVEDGIIRAITSGGSLPRDAARYDCRGLWLMPGVFDCHAHVGMTSDDAWENLNTPYSLRVLQTAGNLRTMLHSGVTFVRDAGGTDAGVRAGLEQGEIEGPALQVAVNLLCQTGGHMDGYLSGADLSVSTEGFMPPAPGRPPFLIDGPEDMRKAVRQVLRAGADWIKLCVTGGIFSGSDGALAPQLSPEELAVAVWEAHKAGKPVMVHAVGGEGVTWALKAGIRSLEHGVFMTEEQVALMARQGTYLVPTLTVYQHLAALAAAPDSPLPPPLVRSGKKLAEQLGQSVRMALEAGVPIALGIDSASRATHGHSLEEIYWLQQAGLTAEQALLSATKRGAELCCCADTLGTLAPGFQFDALLLNRDPLASDAFLKPDTVGGVFQRGRIVRRHPQLSL